jgi:hypothetical protein
MPVFPNDPALPRRARPGLVATLALPLLLSACGGGGGGGDSPAPTPGPAPAPSPAPTPAPAPTEAQRTLAANGTAQSRNNACHTVQPFYWEIGNATGRQASASVNVADPASPRYDAGTVIPIASASKWMFSAYVLERRNGAPTAQDTQFLTLRSGYTAFGNCQPTQTIDSCLASGSNGTQVPAHVDRFFYSGGHMQKHASELGLGAMNNGGLATEMRRLLGTDIQLSYFEPQLAFGVVSSADDYARFLRKLMRGDLRLGPLLGTQAVCTDPATCAQALSTPVPAAEKWQYGWGHWVESDPVVGDGSFSSMGAFGFYPWIDANRQTYGIISRWSVQSGATDASVNCGRLIRKAWQTGIAQSP